MTIEFLEVDKFFENIFFVCYVEIFTVETLYLINKVHRPK